MTLPKVSDSYSAIGTNSRIELSRVESNLGETNMIPSSGIFETHLTVSNLERSMRFYGKLLGFELAHHLPERKVAFYWVGGRGRSMLGVWEAGSGPQRLSLHTAFAVELEVLLASQVRLRQLGIEPLDFERRPTNEPVVLAWMPAGSIYFRDPDDNLLEFVTMLPETPRPELGVVPWSEWETRT
jgi:lactoylglutathione lyase